MRSSVVGCRSTRRRGRAAAGIGGTTGIDGDGLPGFDEAQAAARRRRPRRASARRASEGSPTRGSRRCAARRTGAPRSRRSRGPSATRSSTASSRVVSSAGLLARRGRGPRAMPRTPRSRSRRAAIFAAAAAPIARSRPCASVIALTSSARQSATAASYGQPSRPRPRPPRPGGRPARARPAPAGPARAARRGRRGAARARARASGPRRLPRRGERERRVGQRPDVARAAVQPGDLGLGARDLGGPRPGRPDIAAASASAPGGAGSPRRARTVASTASASARRPGRVALVGEQRRRGLASPPSSGPGRAANAAARPRIESRQRSRSWPST